MLICKATFNDEDTSHFWMGLYRFQGYESKKVLNIKLFLFDCRWRHFNLKKLCVVWNGMKWKGQEMKKNIFSQEGDRKGIRSPSETFMSGFVLSGSLPGRYRELSVLKLLLIWMGIEDFQYCRGEVWLQGSQTGKRMPALQPPDAQWQSVKSRWQNKPGKVGLATNNFSNGWTVTNHSSSHPLRPHWIIRACNVAWKSVILGSAYLGIVKNLTERGRAKQASGDAPLLGTHNLHHLMCLK